HAAVLPAAARRTRRGRREVRGPLRECDGETGWPRLAVQLTDEIRLGCGHDVRIELDSDVRPELLEGVLDGLRDAIGPVRGHRLECVGDAHDAGAERDVVGREPIWIA